jgi:PhoH-like ATPase
MAFFGFRAKPGSNGHKPRRKAYILDTSTIIHDPECFLNFQDNDLFIPYVTVYELDGLRKGKNGRGRSARDAIRFLEDLRQTNPSLAGRKLSSGGTLSILGANSEIFRRIAGNHEGRDDLILELAREFINRNGPLYQKIALVSNDTGMRVKAACLGIPAEIYERGTVPESAEYTGHVAEPLVVTPETLADLSEQGFATLTPDLEGMEENEFLILRTADRKSSRICRRRGERLVLAGGSQDVCGIKGRNAMQCMALDLLLDPEIQLVALIGGAGVGKTLLSVAAGLQQTVKSGALYDQMICIKPIVPVGGKDLGYLPGDKGEKLEPWMGPYIHSLNYIGGYGYADRLLDQGVIHLEAMTYMRGSSIPSTWIMLDEAQNLTPKEIKTAMTRAGEGSKIILLADPSQIDTPYLSRESCGIMHAINAFKGRPLFGMVQLEKSERSELAALSAALL